MRLKPTFLLKNLFELIFHEIIERRKKGSVIVGPNDSGKLVKAKFEIFTPLKLGFLDLSGD